MTWLHRLYLAADVVLLLILGVLMRAPDRGFFHGLAATFRRQPLSTVAMILVAAAALFFSLLVATLPDERLDRMATALWPAAVPISTPPDSATRRAFLPTAVLFEGATDEIQGRPDSVFSRNIVVINTSMAAPINPEPDEPSLNLRGRDLKYATLDRSDFRRADLTGADLTGASLQQTVLIKTRLIKAKLRGADLRNAALISTFVRGADFEGARVCADQRGLFMVGSSNNQEEYKGLVKEACPRER